MACSIKNKFKTRTSLLKNILVNVLVAAVFLSIGMVISPRAPSVLNNESSLNQIDENLSQVALDEIDSEETVEKPITRMLSDDQSLSGLSNSITSTVQKISPSVVNIKVILKTEMRGRVFETEGIGSGIIYDKEGYIITNYHVAGDADSIIATLYDGSEYTAELIGSHEDTDIAVLKIDADELTAANFTTTDNVQVGEIAIAVGSPFGLSQTVTMGVISAKERDILVSYDTLPMVDLIQTDAAINQGNSGGPLVDLKGQVIGINSLIYSTSGANAGIGFAIPSDTAVNIANQIIKYGEARIPSLGIKIGENSTDIPGVYIEEVESGSSFDNAGIKPGDIIIEIEKTTILTSYDILAKILRHNIGDLLDIKIFRNGEYINLEVELN